MLLLSPLLQQRSNNNNQRECETGANNTIELQTMTMFRNWNAILNAVHFGERQIERIESHQRVWMSICCKYTLCNCNSNTKDASSIASNQWGKSKYLCKQTATVWNRNRIEWNCAMAMWLLCHSVRFHWQTCASIAEMKEQFGKFQRWLLAGDGDWRRSKVAPMYRGMWERERRKRNSN